MTKTIKAGSGNSKKWVVVGMVAIVAAGGLYYAIRHKSGVKKTGSSDSSVTMTKKDKSAKTPTEETSKSMTTDAETGQKVKFSDQDYAKSAYLVSGDAPLGTDANQALAGFSLNKQAMADKTVVITLKALKSEYHDQTYTLKPGEQLYFIEKFLQDDKEEDETNIHDDTAVIVDADGYVVEVPRDFSK